MRARAALIVLAVAGASLPATAQPLAVSVPGLGAPERPAPAQAASRVALRSDSLLAPSDHWIARDKLLHTSASLLLTLSGQYVLTDKAGLSNGRALPVAVGTALALGLLKEAVDSRRPAHPLFSWRDLAANAVGVALGAAIVSL